MIGSKRLFDGEVLHLMGVSNLRFVFTRCVFALAVLLLATCTCVPAEKAYADAKQITISQVQKAFNSKVGNSACGKSFYHRCLAYVSTQWSKATGAKYSSICCARKYGSLHRVSSSMNNVPIGADVYFTGSGTPCGSCGHMAGHVGVYVGDGYVVNSRARKIQREKLIDLAHTGNLAYYGWGWHDGVEVVADEGDDPEGELEAVEAGRGTLQVSGWAYDLDIPSKPLQIKVWIGSPSAGGELHTIATKVEDADLNEEIGIHGKHRFHATIKTYLKGDFNVYVYAVNRGSGTDVLIGKQHVSIKKGQEAPSIASMGVYRGGIKVKCKGLNQATGFQVRCSTSKEMTHAKRRTFEHCSSGTVWKLKSHRKYNVQVRAWKRIDQGIYYSPWSEARVVTVK